PGRQTQTLTEHCQHRRRQTPGRGPGELSGEERVAAGMPVQLIDINGGLARGAVDEPAQGRTVQTAECHHRRPRRYRPLDDYAALLADAGLRAVHTEPHDEALATMIDQIDARVRLLRMTAGDRLATAGVDVDAVLHYCAAAKQAVSDGVLGYALLVAVKPMGSP
ncbi:MAG: hypothetical protein ACRDQF_11380, partial [Thermocrispum sp.]